MISKLYRDIYRIDCIKDSKIKYPENLKDIINMEKPIYLTNSIPISNDIMEMCTVNLHNTIGIVIDVQYDCDDPFIKVQSLGNNMNKYDGLDLYARIRALGGMNPNTMEKSIRKIICWDLDIERY